MPTYIWALLGKVRHFSDKNFERKKDTQKHDNILHQHSIQKIVLGQEKMGKCLCFVSLNSPFRFLPCFSQIGSPPPPNTTCTHNYVVCLKIWSLLRLYSTVKVIGCKSCCVTTGIFLDLRCWYGDTKRKPRKQTQRKSRLLFSTTGKENGIEL